MNFLLGATVGMFLEMLVCIYTIKEQDKRIKQLERQLNFASWDKSKEGK